MGENLPHEGRVPRQRHKLAWIEQAGAAVPLPPRILGMHRHPRAGVPEQRRDRAGVVRMSVGKDYVAELSGIPIQLPYVSEYLSGVARQGGIHQRQPALVLQQGNVASPGAVHPAHPGYDLQPYSSRTISPLFPPRLRTSRTFWMRIPLSTDLHMS